jgi:MFS transporter, DHA2 family, methylenomycin A resistance protein
MRRPPLPSVIGDLLVDRRAAGSLLAAAAALFAAGMDPKVWAPSATTTQSAIRANPDLEGLVLLISVATAILILMGGAVGDTTRARPIILGGLSVSFVAAILALLVYLGPGIGPGFVVFRLAGVASAAFVMPVALAMAATSYAGVARATAIGIAYAGYGLGQGLSPILVSLIPETFAPAFVGAILATGLALVVTRRRVPDLERPTRAERPYVVRTALWAAAVVLFSAGLLWVGSGWENPLRLGLMAAGVALMVVFLVLERQRKMQHPESVRVERRPVTIALFVGLVIALAQIVPMTLLPQYFAVGLQYGSVLGIVAMVPMFMALVLAGPVAGILLARVQPRHLIGGGVIVIGLGNVLLAAVIGPTTTYLAFVLPLFLVGAGFVVATTVRTAVIFASVPRGLPATAAALNEASMEVGTRAGIVAVTGILAQVSLRVYEDSLKGLPADQVAKLTATFREVLISLGSPSYHAVAKAVQPDQIAEYRVAYFAGIQTALLLGGGAAILGGIITLIALGRRNPLATVYDLRDERTGTVS